ncbi:esterase-like activity of phytase family protein [Coralliovum pocilloporae]|uniref:esterase-like activity of phytase family protein n=1 Tax=Coralliovum pocilloporae TaxID=3066369 RepID=UPI0033071CE4
MPGPHLSQWVTVLKQAAFGLTAMLAASVSVPSAHADGAFPIKTSTIDRFRIGRSQSVFGPLTFLGGLELSSRTKSFGGLSGIRTLDNGTTFLTVSDTGRWFEMELSHQDFKPVSATLKRSGVLLDRSGRPPRRKWQSDAEALEVIGKDRALVSYEGRSRIWSYSLKGGAIEGRPTQIALPKAISSVRGNKGLEALAVFEGRQEKVVALFERQLDQAGHHTGWLRDNGRWHRISIPRKVAFDITDAAFLDTGGLLILERSFSYSDGVRMHIRHFPPHRIKPGFFGSGQSLIEADLSDQIDNMEGLSVHTGRDGQIVLTLISDDNFNLLQRTILLQFALDTAQLHSGIPTPEKRPATDP